MDAHCARGRSDAVVEIVEIAAGPALAQHLRFEKEHRIAVAVSLRGSPRAIFRSPPR